MLHNKRVTTCWEPSIIVVHHDCCNESLPKPCWETNQSISKQCFATYLKLVISDWVIGRIDPFVDCGRIKWWFSVPLSLGGISGNANVARWAYHSVKSCEVQGVDIADRCLILSSIPHLHLAFIKQSHLNSKVEAIVYVQKCTFIPLGNAVSGTLQSH